MNILEKHEAKIGWFKKFYVSASIILSNAVLLFVLINVASHIALAIRRKATAPRPPLYRALSKYGLEPYIKNDIYNGKLTVAEIIEYYKEEEALDLEYEPYSMFSERKGFTSQFINVSEDGYRLIRNQKNLSDPGKKIFVFGGSTTFGYGLPDNETIPSYLQDYLGQTYSVFNFGRAYYYARQELALLINLILDGQKPTIAIFIDGVNERPVQVGPSVDKAYVRGMGKRNEAPAAGPLPILKILNGTRRRLQSKPTEDPKLEVDRYFQTLKMAKRICDDNGIIFMAFYQPLSIYKYDAKRYHPFFHDASKSKKERLPIYHEIERRLQNNLTPVYFNSLIDLGLFEKRPLYVDGVHYNPYFSKKIASSIGQQLVQKNR